MNGWMLTSPFLGGTFECLMPIYCLLSWRPSAVQVDVQLELPSRVSLMPSLDDIQDCINKSAQAILGCFKHVRPWWYHIIHCGASSTEGSAVQHPKQCHASGACVLFTRSSLSFSLFLSDEVRRPGNCLDGCEHRLTIGTLRTHQKGST